MLPVFIFQIVALILIGVAAYCHVVSIIVSLSLVGGIIASGVFLMLIAIIGYIGAVKHHQVLLFFVSFSDKFVDPLGLLFIYDWLKIVVLLWYGDDVSIRVIAGVCRQVGFRTITFVLVNWFLKNFGIWICSAR